MRIGLLLASVGVSLLLMELAVRTLSTEGDTLLVKDAVVGQRYRPGSYPGRYVPEAGRAIDLRFNELGYRGGPIAPTKPAGVRRVAVLGDSFIAAVAVDEPDTLVEQLAAMLNTSRDAGEPTWKGLNFGVSGNGTAQSLLAWRHFVRDLDPDLVILCFYNGNDLADNHPRASSAHRPYFTLDEQGELVPIEFSASRVTFSRFLAENSQFYVWQKHKMRMFRDRLRASARIIPPGFQIFNADPPDPFPEAWRVTVSLIRCLASEVQEQGARFLLVSIPAHEQIFPERWARLVQDVAVPAADAFDPGYPEKRLLAELGDQVDFLSLRSDLIAAASSEELYFASEGHFTEAGNRIAARAVHDHVLARGVR